MKITELRCSACNGTMKVDPENPNYAVCEYCGTKYLIEWDKMEPTWYQPIAPPEQKKTGWEMFGWKWTTALVITMVTVVGGSYGAIAYQRYQVDHDPEVVAEGKLVDDTQADAMTGMQAGDGVAEPHLEGLLADFAEYAFDQTVAVATEKGLSSIKWLELKTSKDFWEIGYSFETPFENPEAGLSWVRFPREAYSSVDLSGLSLFTGLEMLRTNQYLAKEDIQGLSIKSISGYFDSLEEVAALIEDPAAVREIGMTGRTLSLQGAEQFPNLETLSLDCDQITEPKTLVSMKSLTSLSIDLYEEGMDFSVCGMMPWLERVTISSKKLKDISFISGMGALKELNLSYGTFLDLEPLRSCAGLEALSVERCDELKEMSALSGLTGLKKLKIELPYGCQEPDLSALSAMEELYLDGFEQTSFLRHMPQLETLTLDGCRMDDPSDFDGLVNLTTLTCTAFSASERDYGFITRLPAIEHLNLRGTKTYEDISGIFNLPTLKSLDISGMECEIDFDQISDNTSLEMLLMDHVKLYENVTVSGGGGIYTVDWDDVSLIENLSFLERLKGLQTLSIRENELTDLGFAASLANLRSLDFSDNYVTDLSPLSELRMLREVNSTDNPVSNFDVLGESVVVIK